MKSNWLDLQVSLYKSHSDNTGRPATYRDILLTRFAKDLPAIISIRKLDKAASDYKLQKLDLKSRLQCFTPSALLATKAAGKLREINRTGIMQLDFDYNDIADYDIEDLKRCVFDLPFIAFCGLSCSGEGFYALALIAEPNRLSDYAEHCFEVLLNYGIKADTSKGRKVENLRYLSYDANMLIRYNPVPLCIKHFKAKELIKNKSACNSTHLQNGNSNTVLNALLNQLKTASIGNRWQTVQKVAYSIGGLGNDNFLDEINNVINTTAVFTGEEIKYLKCAEVCFNEGMKKLFINK
jgi:VirE N-terminal domain